MFDSAEELKAQPSTLYLSFEYLTDVVNKQQSLSDKSFDLDELINQAMILLGLAIKYNESKDKMTNKKRMINEHYKMIKMISFSE